MRTTIILAAIMLAGCGGAPEAEKAKAPKPAAGVKPIDESHRFPRADLQSVTQSADPLFGKSFLPGGNVARYKKGAKEYELFLVAASDASSAALLLFDYKKAMGDAKFIAHFGGYAGKDGETPVFLFAKKHWLAGVRGLPEAEADIVARDFAARLN